YTLSDLTAMVGVDYQLPSGHLNFSSTDKVKNISIIIADDLQLEGDELFSISLTNVSVGASIALPAAAIVTLVDNDIVGLSDSVTTTIAPAAAPASSGVIQVFLDPPAAQGQWRLPGQIE